MAEQPIKDIVQLGIVTGDLDRYIRIWADKYGVGPWQVYQFDPSNMTDLTVGGRPVEYGMRLALAFVGTMMLEVLEPMDDRSVYAQSLKKHGGVDHIHHILCVSDDYDSVLEQFRAQGVQPTMSGHMTETRGTFAYLDTENDLGFDLEFFKLPGELQMPEPVEVYPPAAQES